MATNAARKTGPSLTAVPTGADVPGWNTRQIHFARQAFRTLQFGFVVAPVVAGVDKFYDFLTNWDQYLAQSVSSTLGILPHPFMQGAGVVEVIVGIGVLIKPRIFSYIVSVWLLGIVANLIMTGQYFDIALRDFGLALGALALGRLSQDFDA